MKLLWLKGLTRGDQVCFSVIDICNIKEVVPLSAILQKAEEIDIL